MYTILVRLRDGSYTTITSHNALDEAVQVAIELNSRWLQQYIVRGAS